MTTNPTREFPAVCDLHCDTVLELQGGADLGQGNPDGHVDIPRLRKGGVRLQAFACFVPSSLPGGRAFRAAMDLLDEIDRVCARFPGDLRKVETAAEVEAARGEGRIGVMAAVENGHAIDSDPRNLEMLRARGVRYLTLTHFRHLEWAASSGEAFDGDHGLRPRGEEIVREMGRLGIIVDVSHVHERTFWDVVRLARKPFIASHSNAAALCPLPRNLTDDQVKAIAGAGGMVGVNFYPGFLDPSYFKEVGSGLDAMFSDLERMEKEFAGDPGRKLAEMHRVAKAARERQGPPRADLETVVAHVEHMVRLVGDEHVGFGSDFDGITDVPRDVPDCAAYPGILGRLAEKGFSDRSLEKIAWGNFLRVLRDNDQG
jgi:membrane dipeptidase